MFHAVIVCNDASPVELLKRATAYGYRPEPHKIEVSERDNTTYEKHHEILGHYVEAL